jgi:hypothetical protein
MTCGETGFTTGAAVVAMTSVAGSEGLSILVVAPASNPEGAVNRRSGSCADSVDMTSVAGSWSVPEDVITSVAGSDPGSDSSAGAPSAASVTSWATSSG